MSQHYGCNVDVTREPFYCSDHSIHLNDDGTDLVLLTNEIDDDTQDWTGAEPATA